MQNYKIIGTKTAKLEEKPALVNMQPLDWDNNTAKGDGGLVRKDTADGFHKKVVPFRNILLG